MNKYTIKQFREAYPNDDACLDRIFQLRFSNLVCPKCESDKQFTRVKNRRSYQCPTCGFQVYPTKDTVFEKTTTPLTYWFMAIFLQTTTRNGVSAKELERVLNVCYTTALRMNHQIKKLMAGKNKLGKLSGIVQIDEVYLGQSLINMSHKKRSKIKAEDLTKFDNKTGVMGFVSDNNEVKLEVMTDAKTFKQRVKDNVSTDAIIVTDSHTGYEGLNLHYKQHEVVNHSIREFKKGQFHTNSIESTWALLRRTIYGTHIHVSPKYLQLYVDEVAFRLMHKNKQDTMFETILSHVA
ncbi:IS1595 family transposase [Ferruginibacter albus]|uniref:IS1595 family transposase n=1 Tax=Ferruginibacter albus TaxID=2875540 RepID=UPI001CC53FB1|nr:IS1595 family transposase [Ferruginibacter albus]UAY52701.1 IS1595 family transposase [Ferruginibacter albus]